MKYILGANITITLIFSFLVEFSKTAMQAIKETLDGSRWDENGIAVVSLMRGLKILCVG